MKEASYGQIENKMLVQFFVNSQSKINQTTVDAQQMAIQSGTFFTHTGDVFNDQRLHGLLQVLHFTCGKIMIKRKP